VKRVFLVLAGTIVYVVLAIVGASHFQTWLDTLLVILSVRNGFLYPSMPNSPCFIQYWLAIYCTILIEEHFIFRMGRWSNYNVDDYINPSRLPLGIAAAISLCLGVMGAVLGMTPAHIFHR
jgi:purine-cytosine permease-like protein